MKKKTVITTEKHEIWVIKQGDEGPTAQDQSHDTAPSGTESLVRAISGDADGGVLRERAERDEEST